MQSNFSILKTEEVWNYAPLKGQFWKLPITQQRNKCRNSSSSCFLLDFFLIDYTYVALVIVLFC